MLGSSFRRYGCFGTVVWVASPNGPASHVGGGVATGRVFHAAQVKGHDSESVAHY
jgi:hypothetical protein